MRNPAAAMPAPRRFAWYVGEEPTQAGQVTEIFIYDAAQAAGRQLLEQGKLTERVNLYVRPDQPGARWSRFEARPSGEVLSRA